MADDIVDLPFRGEYAKSGRAACKMCKEKIEKGELRLAVMVQVRLKDNIEISLFITMSFEF